MAGSRSGEMRLELPKRECGACRKVLHRNRSTAKAELKRFQRKERVEGQRPGHLTVYRCPQSPGWHVGHDRRRETA